MNDIFYEMDIHIHMCIDNFFNEFNINSNSSNFEFYKTIANAFIGTVQILEYHDQKYGKLDYDTNIIFNNLFNMNKVNKYTRDKLKTMNKKFAPNNEIAIRFQQSIEDLRQYFNREYQKNDNVYETLKNVLSEF